MRFLKNKFLKFKLFTKFIKNNYLKSIIGTILIITIVVIYSILHSSPDTRTVNYDKAAQQETLNREDLQKIIQSRTKSPSFKVDNREVSVEEVQMTRTEIETLEKEEAQRIPEPKLSDGFEEYLKETEIINLSKVRYQAEKLENNPLKIFNFVKNEIEYQPYYGIKRGAEGTLLARKGNDYDQAALLGALLRAGDANGNKKFPTRYVQGKVLLRLSQVMDWIGAEDPYVAAEIFQLHNVPIKTIYDKENTEIPLHFEMELVWVEVYMPYGHYKGMKGEGEKIWVPLVPFLEGNYYSYYGDAKSLDFDGFSFWEEYILKPQEYSPFEKYKNILTEYLSDNNPKFVFEDMLMQRYQSEQTFEFLPLGLPFKLIEEIGKYSEINNTNYKLRFILEKDGDVYLNSEIDVIELINKDLILDYMPTTGNIKSIYDINNISEINVIPIIKTNGTIIRQGKPISLGQSVNFYLDFLEPKKGNNGDIMFEVTEETTKQSIAGVPEAVAIFIGGSLFPMNMGGVIMGSDGYKSEKNRESIPNQFLYTQAIKYLNNLEDEYEEIGEILGAEASFRVARAIVSHQVEIEYEANQPHKLIWQGLTIDATILADYYYRFGQERQKYLQDFMFLSGLEAELDQAEAFQVTFKVESLSTVKGFNLVNKRTFGDVRIVKITDQNKEEIDNLPLSEDTKQFFKKQIGAGSIVYTPNKLVSYHAWQGSWYIILDNNFVADYGSIFVK